MILKILWSAVMYLSEQIQNKNKSVTDKFSTSLPPRVGLKLLQPKGEARGYVLSAQSHLSAAVLRVLSPRCGLGLDEYVPFCAVVSAVLVL